MNYLPISSVCAGRAVYATGNAATVWKLGSFNVPVSSGSWDVLQYVFFPSTAILSVAWIKLEAGGKTGIE